MSKKINPTSLRLGTQLYWNQIVQNYGFKKTPQYPRVLLDTIPIFFLDFPNTNVFLNKTKVIISTQNCKSSVFIHTLKPKQITKSNFLAQNSFIVKNYTYNSLCFSMSATLLLQYALFLFNTKIPLKKILTTLELLLSKKLKTTKLITTKFGFQQFYLKGFQLSLSGRFETSSTQMAKTITQTVGRSPLGRLETYVEFAASSVFFKLGKCNLKIWLFYSTCEHAIIC